MLFYVRHNYLFLYLLQDKLNKHKAFSIEIKLFITTILWSIGGKQIDKLILKFRKVFSYLSAIKTLEKDDSNRPYINLIRNLWWLFANYKTLWRQIPEENKTQTLVSASR